RAIPPPDIHKIRRQVTQSFSKSPRFSAMNQKGGDLYAHQPIHPLAHSHSYLLIVDTDGSRHEPADDVVRARAAVGLPMCVRRAFVRRPRRGARAPG
ncbi:hypothetical protein ACGYRX_24235, partial [Burkholderia pseudomallei]